jgi:hypothetical protein
LLKSLYDPAERNWNVAEQPNIYKPETWAEFPKEKQVLLHMLYERYIAPQRCGTCLNYNCVCGEDY